VSRRARRRTRRRADAAKTPDPFGRIFAATARQHHHVIMDWAAGSGPKRFLVPYVSLGETRVPSSAARYAREDRATMIWDTTPHRLDDPVSAAERRIWTTPSTVPTTSLRDR